jgi:3-oxoacyl-[acyl-carrier-protein] synthase II
LKEGIMAASSANPSAKRDNAGRPVIAITGMGLVTSLGVGKEDNWAKLTAGKSGIRRISRFPLDSLRTTIAGTVDDVYKDYMPPAELSERIAFLACEEAIAQAAIGSKGHFPGPLFLALPPLEIEWPYRVRLAEEAAPDRDAAYPDLMRVAHEPQFAPIYETIKYGIIGENLAAHFGTEGSPISLTTACASGGTAIQLGVEAIRRGECQAVLAVGADGSLTPESLVRFSLLSALSTQNDPPGQASKPFSKNRDGFVLAEGGAALVLEDYDHAIARGAKVLAILEGCGEKSDSFHRTRSSPDGKPVIACMRNALADAGVGPEDIDYINAHGTSTPENDKMECLGVSTVFGERIHGIPMSSNKSMIGHTLTAAGAVEAVFTALTLEHQRIPPTINYRVPDPAIPLDVVPNKARDAHIERAISNSFGFGGQNISLVLAREPA